MVKVTAALQRPRSYVLKLIVPNGGNFGGRKDSATLMQPQPTSMLVTIVAT